MPSAKARSVQYLRTDATAPLRVILRAWTSSSSCFTKKKPENL